jgi:hypothetical protein
VDIDAWIAFGADETLASLRRRLPERIRFLAHGHRIGFAVIARERLSSHCLRRTAAEAAEDVTTFDQQGCVSPRLFLVEEDGEHSPLDLAQALAEALEARRETRPRRPLAAAEAAAIHQQRAGWEMRALAGEPVALFRGEYATEWTVALDPSADLAAGSDRTAVLRPLRSLHEVPRLLAPYRPYLQTAAVAADETRWPEIAALLAAAGVSRLCPLGQAQFPAPGWHHDGRPRLADLVHWVDWEGG